MYIIHYESALMEYNKLQCIMGDSRWNNKELSSAGIHVIWGMFPIHTFIALIYFQSKAATSVWQ